LGNQSLTLSLTLLVKALPWFWVLFILPVATNMKQALH